ncbi:MAG: hypothetical protein V4440_14685 [Pseudomonadota bacterium]
MTTKKTGLELLREPFPEHQISKLPKGTKAQNECDYSEKRACKECGGFHHPKIIHLDYVGHAALTDRLLDCDPAWDWQPLAVAPDGYPVVDKEGGMWIRLTVCGVTRIGYGDAQGKTGGNAVKERIGDALRNAAMRFGAALDLWHKGDLHIDEDEVPSKAIEPVKSPAPNLLPPPLNDVECSEAVKTMNECTDMETLKGIFGGTYKRANDKQKVQLTDSYNARKLILEKAE